MSPSWEKCILKTVIQVIPLVLNYNDWWKARGRSQQLINIVMQMCYCKKALNRVKNCAKQEVNEKFHGSFWPWNYNSEEVNRKEKEDESKFLIYFLFGSIWRIKKFWSSGKMISLTIMFSSQNKQTSKFITIFVNWLYFQVSLYLPNIEKPI